MSSNVYLHPSTVWPQSVHNQEIYFFPLTLNYYCYRSKENYILPLLVIDFIGIVISIFLVRCSLLSHSSVLSCLN